MVDVLLFASPIAAVLRCTYQLSHGHTNAIQSLYNWLHSGGTAVEYSVDQTLPSVGWLARL